MYKTSSCSYYLNRNYFPVNGLNSVNCYRPYDRKRFDASAPANVINNYKKFVREKLSNNIFESNITKFVEKIENDVQIQSFSEAIHLVNEFSDLENQYILLSKQIDFRPFYASISRRIRKYRDGIVSWDENVNDIEYLYATAQNKSISKISDRTTVWNLNKFIEEIEENIEQLKESEKNMLKNSENTVNEVKKGMQELDILITTNLVLEKYELFILALKQHTFPFIYDYFHDFEDEIPMNLQTNDIENLKQKAIKQINDVKYNLALSEATLTKKDNYLFSDTEFGEYVPPFFVWEYDENKRNIQKMLQGEEVFMSADIVKGFEKYAVKFREIGIFSKAKITEIQNELDERLRNFEVTMKMIGNCYYRCGQRIYTFPTDENIQIKYEMDSNTTGTPTLLNDTNEASVERDLFLSPYGLWSIQLKNVKNAHSLGKFFYFPINVELRGRGGYLDRDDYVKNDICTDKLDEMYTLDSIIYD